MPLHLAVENTPLANASSLALCAEQVPARATIIYCMVGSDTIAANIFALSLSQLRAQCLRISRQMQDHGFKVSNVEASIFVLSNGSDVDILVRTTCIFSLPLLDVLKGTFSRTIRPRFG